MESLAPETPNLTPHMLKSDLWKFFKYKKPENYNFRGTKLYSTVQYINTSVILSSEMSSLAKRTMEKTYYMPIVNVFVKTVLYRT